MALCFMDQEKGKTKPNGCETYSKVKGFGTEAVPGSDPAREKRRSCDGDIPGEFIQAHGKPSLTGAGEIDFHDYRCGPGEALAYPQEYIGDEYPIPIRRPHKDEGDRNGNDPTAHQHALSSEPFGPPSRHVIGGCFRHSEYHDERKYGGSGGQVELTFGDGRKNAPFHADHRADESVDDNEQRELSGIFPESKPDMRALGVGRYQVRGLMNAGRKYGAG